MRLSVERLLSRRQGPSDSEIAKNITFSFAICKNASKNCNDTTLCTRIFTYINM